MSRFTLAFFAALLTLAASATPARLDRARLAYASREQRKLRENAPPKLRIVHGGK